MKSFPLPRPNSAGTLSVAVLTIAMLGITASIDAADDPLPNTVQETLGETGLSGGFIVHVGCSDGKTLAVLSFLNTQ